MKAPKSIIVNDKTYILFPMKLEDVGLLNISLLQLLAPAMPIFGDAFTSGKMDLKSLTMDKLMTSIQGVLTALPNKEHLGLLTSLMMNVQTEIPDSEGNPIPTFIKTSAQVNAAFDDILSMYKVALEVAKYNKFLPFGMLATGNPT